MDSVGISVYNKSNQKIYISYSKYPLPGVLIEGRNNILPGGSHIAPFIRDFYPYLQTLDGTLIDPLSYSNINVLKLEGLRVTINNKGANVDIIVEDDHSTRRKYL